MTLRAVASLALVCAAALPVATADAQSLLRGPYLQSGSESSIVIRWRSDTPTASVVRFGTAPDALDTLALEDGSRTEHAVLVDGLAPDTRYHYAVGDDGGTLAGAASGSFVTAPPPGEARPTRIWVLGDSGTADANARAVRDAYLADPDSSDTDLVVMLGDNAYPDGTDAEYQAAVFDMHPETLRGSVLWPTLGNHDGHTADSATESGPYYDIFTLPRAGEAGGVASGTEAYYSFDHGNIHFVSLDSYETNRSRDGAMLSWLESDLAATDKPWIIAFWHHPPYSKGSHDSDGENPLIEMRENALPILESYGVDLVLSGHSHSYERSMLLDGHYGDSSSLDPSMVIDGGDGRDGGDGAYRKPDIVGAARAGAVYAVAGSSGKVSGGTLDHPAMKVSLSSLGSLAIDVDGNRLDARFIDASGATRDDFTVLKGADTTAPTLDAVVVESATSLVASFSEALDPVAAETTANYAVSPDASVEAAALEPDGRSVRLTVSPLPADVEHRLAVTGVSDLAGNPVAAGSELPFVRYALTTVAFRDGESPDAGYAGTRDSTLVEAAPDASHGGEATLRVDGNDPSGSGQDVAAMLAFGAVDAIPADAIVVDAEIEVHVTNPTPGSYPLYALERPWSEVAASWLEADAGLPWSAPGAGGADDRGAETIGSLAASETGPYTITLNAAGRALVERWIGDPASNHGLIVADPTLSNGVDFASREALSTATRPRLSVTYRRAGGDTTAPTVPGAFVAVDVGSDRVALDWQAASDDTAVAGYRLRRDGVEIATTVATAYVDTEVEPGTEYSYELVAFDAAGNVSAPAGPLAVTTDAVMPATLAGAGLAAELERSGGRVRARVEAAVADADGMAVAGATVEGRFEGLTDESVSAVTDENGVATLRSSTVHKNSSGTFTFVLGTILAEGFVHDGGADLDSTICIGADGALCADDGDPPEALDVERLALVLSRQGRKWSAEARLGLVEPGVGAVGGARVVLAWSLRRSDDTQVALGSSEGTTDADGALTLVSPAVRAEAGDALVAKIAMIAIGDEVYGIASGPTEAETTLP